jgi:hypothetical protein
MFLFEQVRNFYGRFERPISSLSLVAGFVFDALTLKRVDTLWENMWVLGHLLIVSTFMVLIHSRKSEEGDEADPSKAHFWYVNIIQFFFGGILSTYLVFYFRSADLFTTWPFIFILALAFIANESLKRHYVRLSFQISLLFLSIYSFAIFLLPVLTHTIGPEIFILSGFASLFIITVFMAVLFHFSKDKFDDSKRMIVALIAGITLIVNFLYFSNLIPPIPLSLKDGGIYHSIERNADGNYNVTYEDRGWWGYFVPYKDVNVVAGTPVYAFSAIFSPNDLNITVVHRWQYYDLVLGKWVTDSIVHLPVLGGREGGFRTYSLKSNIRSGKWRVSIETEAGQIIGRIRFLAIESETPPPLLNEVK